MEIVDIEKYSYLVEWKTKMAHIIRMKYSEDQISDKKIEKYLNSIIQEKLNNRKVLVVNNYTNKVAKMTILDLINIIRSSNLVCTGGGCLFLPHGKKRNILIEFIQYIKEQRSVAKKERKLYEKGTEEWEEADRKQLAYKIIINSLYGCLGYPGFIMFNIFLAEAITNQGRHIITTAINANESFLGNSHWFENESEVYNTIYNIDSEFYSKTKGKISKDFIDKFDIDLNNLPLKTTDRYLQHCIFTYSDNFKKSLYTIFSNMDITELIVMYYKNNFIEFSNLPFMRDKIKSLIVINGKLTFCEDYCYKDETSLNILRDIWDFYEFFVLYNYPLYDRMQKAMYLDKGKSLYTDTDSVFLSLNEAILFIENKVFNSVEESGLSSQDLTFTAANFTLSIINRSTDAALKTLCRYSAIPPEFAKLLRMKNEFFFQRIMFQDVKKRYISLALLQEGQVLGDGLGLPEIKGFDFIKAGTKPYVKNYYTSLCLDEILYSKEIKPQRVFKKVLALKYDMENSIKHGNMEFFKQANVKRPEYYINPYSTQGVCAIMLWNALSPERALEFPADVNIVPIKPLTFPKPKKSSKDSPINRVIIKEPLDYKNILEYSQKHPEAYNRLYKTIYMNENSLIRHMTLSYIAIPKNLDYELPKYVTDLFNIESIINDTISLILPVMKTIGINSFQVTSNVEYLSNMVSL